MRRAIVEYPDPRLRNRSEPIPLLTEEVAGWVRDLTDTMYSLEAVGIAAIQVGLPWRLFVLDGVHLDLDPAEPWVFINPELELSKELEVGNEGCLCFPGVTFRGVKRATWARVKAAGLDGLPIQLSGGGLVAQALQHEFDHLEGKLVLDRLSPLARKMALRQRIR